MPEEANAAKKLAGILVPIIFSMIFVVGVTGNALVIAVLTRVFKRESQGLNTTNRFILNLAVADLLFLFFCVPFQAPIYTTDFWPFGAFMCVFCEVCQMISMLASIYTMVALSLDRYFAIVYATSTRQYRTRTNANFGLLAIWGLSIGLGTAALLTRRLDVSSTTEAQTWLNYTQTWIFETTQIEDAYDVAANQPNDFNGNEAVCMPNVEQTSFVTVYRIVIATLGYLVPLLINFICYMGVLRTMSVNLRNTAASTNQRSQEAKKRVTKIVILVVLCFAIDWFPYHFCGILFRFVDFKLTEAAFALPIITHCLSYSNSCVNPIIYAFMSKQFRYDLKNIFKKFKISRCRQVKFCSKYFPRRKSKESEKETSNLNNSLKENSKLFLSPTANATHDDGDDKKEMRRQEESNSTCLITLTPAICHPTRCFLHEQTPLTKTTVSNFQNLQGSLLALQKENASRLNSNLNGQLDNKLDAFMKSNDNLSPVVQVQANSNEEKSDEEKSFCYQKKTYKSKKNQAKAKCDKNLQQIKDARYSEDENSEMF